MEELAPWCLFLAPRWTNTASRRKSVRIHWAGTVVKTTASKLPGTKFESCGSPMYTFCLLFIYFVLKIHNIPIANKNAEQEDSHIYTQYQ